MPRLECFVVAETVSIDKLTNAVSLFNILEEVHSRTFPFLVPKVAVFSLWRKEAGDEERDWQALLKVTQPSGEARDRAINFRFSSSRRHRLIQRISGLPVLTEGDVRFELLLNGQHAAEHIVSVTRVSESGPSHSLDPERSPVASPS